MSRSIPVERDISGSGSVLQVLLQHHAFFLAQQAYKDGRSHADQRATCSFTHLVKTSGGDTDLAVLCARPSMPLYRSEQISQRQISQ